MIFFFSFDLWIHTFQGLKFSRLHSRSAISGLIYTVNPTVIGLVENVLQGMNKEQTGSRAKVWSQKKL